LGACHIQVSHHRDFNAATRTTLNFFLVTVEHFKRASAHSANA
jgi:hypothetical protein